MGSVVILNDVRLSHPHLWTPAQPMQGSTSGPKYDATGIFAPTSEAGAIAQQAFMAEAQKTFGENWRNIIMALDKGKKCLRDGNTKLSKEGKQVEGYPGNLFLVAKNKAKPVIISDRFFNGAPIELDEQGGAWQNGTRIEPGVLGFKPEVPYGGCYVNLKVEIYGMNKPGLQGMYATLMAVQYRRKGASFGGGGAPSADGFEEGDYDEGEVPSALSGFGAAPQAGNVFGAAPAQATNVFGAAPAQQPQAPWDAAPPQGGSLFG